MPGLIWLTTKEINLKKISQKTNLVGEEEAQVLNVRDNDNADIPA